ncbi:MAG: hypothetical protein JW751_19975 [Polyangiaceae bacterium]|nr:hypothetical protein [Polyangiaceae bacterium]
MNVPRTPSSSFRITTHRVPARVRLASGTTLTGQFSCAEQARQHVGSETLSDLLNDAARFVPFFAEGRDDPVLLGKHAIRTVELLEPDGVAPVEAFGEERAIEVLLDDGTELLGSIHVAAPIGHTRTLDFLNETGRFVRVRRSDGVVLVNVAVVVVVADAG